MTATFNAAAAAYPLPISWQWQISDGSGGWGDLEDDNVYSGATSSSLNVEVTTLDQNGDEFRAVASNSFGDAISESATLTVISDGTGGG